MAEDKIPLRFPLGLMPGITADSTSNLLKSKGAKKSFAETFSYKMNFGTNSVEVISPDYYNGQLMLVNLWTTRLDETYQQSARLSEIGKFIDDTYLLNILEDKTGDIKIGADIMDRSVFQAQSDSFSVELYSTYSHGDFTTMIIFRYIPLWNQYLEDKIKEKEQKEKNSKKDL
jgi:hypothetical protein